MEIINTILPIENEDCDQELYYNHRRITPYRTPKSCYFIERWVYKVAEPPQAQELVFRMLKMRANSSIYKEIGDNLNVKTNDKWL